MSDEKKNAEMLEPKGLRELKTNPPSAAVYYYYYYLKFIHDLISKNIVTPYWYSINDMIKITEYQNKLFKGHPAPYRDKFACGDIDFMKKWFPIYPSNRWLASTSDSPEKLGEDIVKNGGYVPFFLEQGGHFSMGGHRLSSLIYYHNNIEPITKLFLILKFNQDAQVFNAPDKMGFMVPYLSFGFVTSRMPKDLQDIRYLLDTNGGACANLIFDYNKRIDEEPEKKYKKIIAAPCLNNQESFDKFVKAPFSDQYLSEISKHYPLIMPFPAHYGDPKDYFFQQKKA